MVKYSTIIQAIDDYVQKCGFTVAEMRRKLSHMDSNEKYSSLLENNLLNEGELKDYKELLKDYDLSIGAIKDYEESISQVEKENPSMAKFYKQTLNEIKEESENEKEMIFQYVRRILDRYKSTETKVVDNDDSSFQTEKQYDLDHFDGNEKNGKIEQSQINSQKKVNFTDENLSALSIYYGNDYNLNSRLNNGKSWNKLSKEEQNAIKSDMDNIEKELSDAINRTSGLKQDTVLFHGGIFDPSKMVGDKIKFNGYLSCSFQESIAENFHNDDVPSTRNYTFRILAKEGTKGVCANDKSHGGSLTNYTEEHEFLLDKGLEFDIVDIDYDNQVVTIRP